MDNKVDDEAHTEKTYVIETASKKSPGSVMFEMIKNIIMEENTLLLQLIATKHRMDVEYLKETYLKPEYYVPIVDKS